MPGRSNRRVIYRTESSGPDDTIRYEDCKLQLSNFLIGAPVLVPKNKTWPSRHRPKEEDIEHHLIITNESDDYSDSSPDSEKAQAGSDASHSTPTDKDKKRNGNHSHNSVNGPNHRNGKAREKSVEPICLKKKTSARKTSFLSITVGGMDISLDVDDTSPDEAPRTKAKQGKKGKTRVEKNNAQNSATPDASAKKSSASGNTSTEGTVRTTTEDGTQTTEDEAVQTEDNTKAAKQKTGKTRQTDSTSNVGPTAEDSNPGNFTDAQDATILDLKASGKPWVEIGAATGRGKKEVQRRWKELQGRTGAQPAGTSTQTAPADTRNEADNEQTPSNKKGKKDKNKKNTDGNNAGSKATRGGTSRDSPPKGHKQVTFVEDDSEAEREAQMDAMFTAMYSNLRDVDKPPPLRPDELFSERDCAMLGVIEGQRRKNRWLELQAAFFNATGRMVSAELIQRKFEEADKAKKA